LGWRGGDLNPISTILAHVIFCNVFPVWERSWFVLLPPSRDVISTRARGLVGIYEGIEFFSSSVLWPIASRYQDQKVKHIDIKGMVFVSSCTTNLPE
jgi:hypothetical protein